MSFLDALVVAWLFVINVATVLAFGWDKWRAGRARSRVAERTLIGLAAVGGWPGGWLAMRWFRHKTVKASFRLKYYLALVPFGAGLWAWCHFACNWNGLR